MTGPIHVFPAQKHDHLLEFVLADFLECPGQKVMISAIPTTVKKLPITPATPSWFVPRIQNLALYIVTVSSSNVHLY
jgi:hypothetical protein